MKPLLVLSDVWVAFSRGSRMVRVLEGVNLELAAGELFAVLARPAQGKSTLLRVAAAAQRPDHGLVIFDGVDLWQDGLRSALSRLPGRRRQIISDRRRRLLSEGEICFVANDRPGVDLKVRDLVALPLRCGHRKAYAQAERALRRVGLTGCAEERWDNLADTERALLMLARAVVRKSRLVLLDDLMVRLSVVAGEHVGRLLRTLAEEDGFAVLMSVADTRSTVWCDQTGSLAAGTLQFACEEASEEDEAAIGIIDRSWRAVQ